ncbi:MIP/aquaporin family protein [Stackebrandtia nassauensis]|uniref:MIP family channel protein n=1 Tax=Stackebrandtia nassauensis (strain DSM 44728 / CIP 108903 / NRRL B-16338 / NBRC 102104 / LLR-40K-21) TaxID=446470 RepID=D3PZE0_STANL|nr:MIP/aquaporin family protein [Stackebrandtia nassauensis]ADD41614.1 MIP family channel protein [Stackebrandtia nassauensis DSM 44728]
MSDYIAEVIGTMILILLGNGVVAGVVLTKSKAKDAGWVVITFAWGLAVAMAVYAVGRISGAHLNPAVTIAMAAGGDAKFGWELVPGYIAAQMIGAIIGQTLVFLAYYKHWGATDDAGAKLAAHSTSPAIPSKVWNSVTEVIGTFMLVFGILAIGANGKALGSNVDLQTAFGTGFAPLLVGLLVVVIGMSLGGPTGYAINPARDLGPRIAHQILPIAGKGSSEWSYAWVPVAAPIVGGLLATGLWTLLGNLKEFTP